MRKPLRAALGPCYAYSAGWGNADCHSCAGSGNRSTGTQVLSGDETNTKGPSPSKELETRGHEFVRYADDQGDRVVSIGHLGYRPLGGLLARMITAAENETRRWLERYRPMSTFPTERPTHQTLRS